MRRGSSCKCSFTYAFTHVHTCIHSYLYMHTFAHLHTQDLHMHTHTYTPTNTHKHIHTPHTTHADTDTQTHALAHDRLTDRQAYYNIFLTVLRRLSRPRKLDSSPDNDRWTDWTPLTTSRVTSPLVMCLVLPLWCSVTCNASTPYRGNAEMGRGQFHIRLDSNIKLEQFRLTWAKKCQVAPTTGIEFRALDR